MNNHELKNISNRLFSYSYTYISYKYTFLPPGKDPRIISYMLGPGSSEYGRAFSQLFEVEAPSFSFKLKAII